MTMNEQEYDILKSSKELKKSPFTVPEGYFDSLKAEARKCTEPQYTHVNLRTRLAPYAAIAAMFLFIFVLGKVFIQTSPKSANNKTELAASVSEYEDYLVFNDISTDLSMYYIEEDHIANNTLYDDEIIEYLIYTGVSEEYIEYNKQ